MRTTSNIIVALLLLGAASTASVQRSDGQRIGVSRAQLLPWEEHKRATRDTLDSAPAEVHGRSNAKIGAIVGAFVGVVTSLLAYKKCGDGYPQSDKSACGIELMVVAPVTMGAGALIGGLIGRAHPSTH